MSDETAPQPKARASWYLGTVAAFFIFALFAAYASRITYNYPDDDAQRAAARVKTLDSIQKSEGALLNPVGKDGRPTAEWVEQDKGLIRVPIEEAMAREVIDLQGKAPAIGAEIPGAAPAPAKAPAPAANAPASAAPAAAPAPAAPGSTPAPPNATPGGKPPGASTTQPASNSSALKKEKGAKK